MIDESQSMFEFGRGRTVIDGRSRIKNYQRETINNASNDQEGITAKAGKNHKGREAGNTQHEPEAMRDRVCKFFDRQVFEDRSFLHTNTLTEIRRRGCNIRVFSFGPAEAVIQPGRPPEYS